MFAIVDTNTREVLDLLEERPKKNTYQPPILPVYVTTAESANLLTPTDEWVMDTETESHLVHTPGTIIPQPILNAAIVRQDNLKTRVNLILTFAKGLNGRSFDSLTTQELKGLLQLQLAINRMIDINGNIDLSDFTVDSLINTLL